MPESLMVASVYRKLHLWNDEAVWFTREDEPAPVIETRHGRIGVSICHDIEFPELTPAPSDRGGSG